MQYADFEYYKNTFCGRLITTQEEFCSLEVKSSAYIEKITFDRAKTAPDTDKVKNAVCAACEVYKQFSAREGISSENNDGYSVSYSQNSPALEKRLYQAAALHLSAELLYRGF